MNQNYLAHYGVLGMKWGVRSGPQRGMFTRKRQVAADKKALDRLNSGKRLSYGITKKRQEAFNKRDKEYLEKRIEKNEKILSEKQAKKDKKNTVKTMSDDELRKKINRLQMEKQYSQLTEKDTNAGMKYAKNIMKAGVTVATVTSTALTIYNNSEAIKKIIEKKMG